MSLDHGVLSIPNRTKNINKELDKYKAQKAKDDRRKLDDIKFINGERLKQQAEQEKPIKERAWQEYKKESKAMIEKYGNKLPHRFGSNQNCRDFLRDTAKHEPQVFLNILAAYRKGLEL